MDKTLINKLISEGYKELGWANDGKEFSISNAERLTPLQIIEGEGFKVLIDHTYKEILHVDMQD